MSKPSNRRTSRPKRRRPQQSRSETQVDLEDAEDTTSSSKAGSRKVRGGRPSARRAAEDQVEPAVSSPPKSSRAERPANSKQSALARTTVRKRVAAKEVQVGTRTAVKKVSSAAQERTAARRAKQLSILDDVDLDLEAESAEEQGDAKVPNARTGQRGSSSKRTATKVAPQQRPLSRHGSQTKSRSFDAGTKKRVRSTATTTRKGTSATSAKGFDTVEMPRSRRVRQEVKPASRRRGRNPMLRSLVELPYSLVPSGRRPANMRKLPVTDTGERLGRHLTIAVASLTLFGLVMVLSASSVTSLYELGDSPFFQFKRQVAWALMGAISFFGFSRLDYRQLRRVVAPLLAICALAMVAVLLPGVGTTAGGSTRWLGYGPFLMQPSELVKLAVVIVSADLLTRRERRMDRPELTVRPIMFMVIFFSALLLLQPKLGTALILGAVSFLMLFIAGACWKSLARWVALATVAASLLAYGASYRRARLLVFLNPWDSPDGGGFQVIQSQVSIASGGWFGVGLGASRAKWGFLPTAQSDFIFAVVAEEVGLIGSSALIGGFVVIGWLGFRAAIAAPERFGTLLAAGITCWILVQAFLNIGMVLSVLPTTGEPLPFVSAGGSSLMAIMAAAGVLTSVARRSKLE